YNRAVSGYGWEQDGRFFANAIMWILNLKYEFFKIKQTDFFSLHNNTVIIYFCFFRNFSLL
ncbi:hypothetical protein, partial [Acetobacter indonesiensis]|uniref:hypothetical protein n=1 Tax=Acetobacter indonesiensis TaxID=104101 RepID=UPI0039EBC288